MFWPEQMILPSPHCRQRWPRPRTVQARPDPQTDEQLAAIHTHSWPKSGNPKEAELFPDNGAGPGGRGGGGRLGEGKDVAMTWGTLFFKNLINAAIGESPSSLWAHCISTTWDVKHRFLGPVTETPIPARPGKDMRFFCTAKCENHRHKTSEARLTIHSRIT